MCNPITLMFPDSLLAKGVEAGYEWEVVHNRRGFRCGYVRVPLGHPWHGKHHPDCSVHGDVNVARPDVGGPDDGWWLGFDCNHYMDAPDPDLPGSEFEISVRAKIPGLAACVIRTQEYVENECRRLAQQAAAAAKEAGVDGR